MTHKGTVLDLHCSGYKVLVIPTTKYIITGTDYHFVIKLWDQDFNPLWASYPSADFLTL